MGLASVLASFPLPLWGQSATSERPPAVAGSFYPGEKDMLEAAVRTFLEHAPAPRKTRPIAIVSPHAGYRYSGQIAADAWRAAEGGDYDVVVILGTNHTTAPFDGMSVFRGAGYRTALGLAEIDRAAAEALAKEDPKAFEYRARAERQEHSVEVQVPFAQVSFPDRKIVAAVVGTTDPSSCARFGRALAQALRGRRPLIVASSDLSHFPAYDDAVAADRAVLAALATLDAERFLAAIRAEMRKGRPALETCACGEGPILVALEAARQLGATHARILGYANSGDTALGDRGRVVGYGAVAFEPGPGSPDTSVLEREEGAESGTALSPQERRILLAFARETIEQALRTHTFPLARGFPPSLERKQGVFVTLRENGGLRGCIGRREADLPLGQVVGAMAVQAAFNDMRFPPVREAELPALEIEISLLGPLERVESADQIRLGRDGVYLLKDDRAALFLPEVAPEQGWTREEMLEHLCRKAGLPAGAWREGAALWVFRSERVREADERSDPHL